MNNNVYDELLIIEERLNQLIEEAADKPVNIENACGLIYSHVMKIMFIKNIEFRPNWGGTIYSQYKILAGIRKNVWRIATDDDSMIERIKSIAIDDFEFDHNKYSDGMFEEARKLFPDITKLKDLDYIIKVLSEYGIKTDNYKLVGFLKIKDKEWKRVK